MIQKFRVPILLISAVALTAIFFLLFQKKGNDTVFFDFQKVYNESALKKKLEADLEKVVSSRKSQLDSLRLELSLFSNKIEGNKASAVEISDFEVMKEQFLSRQNMYEEENMRLKENYYNQINKEINDKARLFCEKNGYDFLLSNQKGTLVFGAESNDVTSEFQKFLNK